MFTTLLIEVLFKATMSSFIKEVQVNNFGKKKKKKVCRKSEVMVPVETCRHCSLIDGLICNLGKVSNRNKSDPDLFKD